MYKNIFLAMGLAITIYGCNNNVGDSNNRKSSNSNSNLSTNQYLEISPRIMTNEQTFLDNGGDLNNVINTIDKANDKLVQKSYDKPFLPVGLIQGPRPCTATWLGEDLITNQTFILTAMHC